MFAKLPKQLTSPFGLLGDDAKLAFCSGPDGIQKLANMRGITETDSYWQQYTTLFDSASDVFSLISPQDVRRALTAAPENVAMLVKVVSNRLFQLLSDHGFPAPPSVVGLATSLMSPITPGAAVIDPKTKEVLNCMRVLERVLPAVFEVEIPQFEEQLLWAREVVVASNQEPEQGAQFVIEDEDDETNEQQRTSAAPSRIQETLPSRAERLISTAVDLLFCCGFTLPSKVQVDHHKVNHLIWERGVGSTQEVGTSRDLDMNKSEVLRLLLVLLSRQIYFTPTTVLLLETKTTAHFVQHLPRRIVLTVLCSLLNTAMNSSRPGFSLPYNHLVWKGDDPREILVGMCLQVLCVSLDYQAVNARDVDTAESAAPTAKTNSFRYFIAKLHRPTDLEFILTGIVGILDQFMGTLVNMLPGSRKPVPHLLETVILLWKMIELNKKFKAHLLASERMSDIVVYLLAFSLELKDKPHHHGLCRALSYILQSLSAEAAFGQRLGNPVKVKVPTKWQTVGTTADFMINSIYSLVATTNGALSSLYPAMIISLSNSAPYLQNLSVTAATRLTQLLTAFANPQFLLADEGHPRLLFFMLETFNGILYHHPAENPNVLYGLVRTHKLFEDLGTFTLISGLREIRRLQLAKEEQDKQKAARNPSQKQESTDAGVEKALLLQHEAASTDSVQHTGTPLEPMSPTREVEIRAIDPETGHVSPPSGRASADESHPLSTEEGQRMGRMSEKARGKMRARQESIDVDVAALERIAAGGIGRNGFVPTQEWVTSWQQGLPLDPIMLTITEIRPKVLDIQARRGHSDIGPVLDFLRVVTLGHVLSEVPPIMPRRFQWSDSSLIWLTSLIWGEIYVRATSPLGIWNNTDVRLFYVKHKQSLYRPIAETVSNVVGGLGGFLGRTNSQEQAPRSRPQPR
ncbi:high-temperature-induced dauer-formation protein-domain-containing protein [Auriculariales sp. MPI-PUGE-AT-0066]|nr:high-temperature-induced dauer-formation protein-domain-containing protein [Auriculariales sp. MPI-PUGE-AT-0066]